jgi:PilZ domain-containing protein
MTHLTAQGVAGTALVLCKEAETRRLLVESLQPLAIRAEVCDEAFTAISLLDRRKFEAVIVDLRLGEEAWLVMGHLRFSRANRTAVTFAVTSEEPAQGTRVKPDSTFVLQRPLTVASVNQIFRAAYGLVVRERRRYFRCLAAVPVYIGAQGLEELLCETVNISEGGVAISCGTALDPDLPLRVRFNLPDRTSQLSADAKVCWSGKGRLVGLQFLFLSSSQKSELQEWLARKLDETLPAEVAALFRNVGQAPQ